MARFSTDKVVKLQGKEYVLFEGLLEVAHAHCDLKGIATTVLQMPTKDDPTCMIQAVVTTGDGSTFTGIGDASPANVNKMIIPHIPRMAETRAIARALRFLTGFGTAFEELGDISEVQVTESVKKPVQSVPAPAPVKPQAEPPKVQEKPKEAPKPKKDGLEVTKAIAPVEEPQTVRPVTDEELRELFGDDIEIVHEDEAEETDSTPIGEQEYTRLKAKCRATGAKDVKDYGKLYELIRTNTGIQIKRSTDLQTVNVTEFATLCKFLDSKKDLFAS